MFSHIDAPSLRPILDATGWPAARTRALRGQCRAGVLGNWSSNIDKRLGEGASDALVEALAREGLTVERGLDPGVWIAVAVQLRLTELIADRALGGDRRAMLGAIVDDVVAGTSRAGTLALRALGPRALFDRFGSIHALAYDVGAVSIESRRGGVTIRCEGAELFEQPTWQLLQLAAVFSVFELTRRPGSIERIEPDRTSLMIEARW